MREPPNKVKSVKEALWAAFCCMVVMVFIRFLMRGAGAEPLDDESPEEVERPEEDEDSAEVVELLVVCADAVELDVLVSALTREKEEPPEV